MRILFWGTPEFAVPSLRALDDEGFDIVGVVTQPDRPAGRGRHPRASPVKSVALDQGMEVLTPESPREAGFIDAIRALEPDVSVVVAYGHILPTEILAVPRLGSINVHASLLPALRGAAPINWAIARGHEKTGVTIMRMVREMDAGTIIQQVEEPILPDESASELSLRLSELGAEVLIETLALLSEEVAEEREQDHAAATFAPKIDRDTAQVDWSRPALEVALHVRSMDELPGAWSTLAGEPLKLFRPTVEAAAAGPTPAAPGTVLEANGGLVVSTGAGGAVRLGEVQPSGGRRMRASDWIRGRRLPPGLRFE
ncbi:MAG: methionyl-tRNA formyltransferase [Gemmatimonadetes bacterium]|nr:methionyl-tRNA formyltransferase [Gemmatimonadota bacterium]